MELPKYIDFSDKKSHFTCCYKVINSAADFDAFYANLVAQHQQITQTKNQLLSAKGFKDALGNPATFKFVYRGLSNAAFKNFTSAQRDYMTCPNSKETSFAQFVRKEIDELFNISDYQSLVANSNSAFNDWHALSFLQHFLGDSICLDFTNNLDIALYFMIDGATAPVGNDLSDYMSLYYMVYPWEYDIANSFAYGAKNANKMVAEARNEGIRVYTSEVAKKIISQPFEELYEVAQSPDNVSPFMAIDKQSWTLNAPALGIPPISMSIQNPNINAQDGCFAVVLHESTPYEHGKLCCVDVHRSLVKHIEDNYLKPKGIDQTIMYPNPPQYLQIAREAKALALNTIK